MPRLLREFRMQALMVIRLQQQPADMPFLNGHRMEAYCSPLLGLCQDADLLQEALRDATTLISDVLAKTGLTKSEARRTRAFTRALINAASPGSTIRPAVASRQVGIVKRFNDVRGFGFIEREADTDVFLHISEIKSKDEWHPVPGARVEFTVSDTPKGSQARNVTFLGP